MEHIFDAFLCQTKSGHKFIIGSQGRLKLHGHAGHYGIDTFFVHLSETQPALFQKQMTGMLTIVQVIGIVYDAFDVALIIAHLHARFKYISISHNRLQR